MKRGLRLCAALLALLALLASTVEQAWAVTCLGMDATPAGVEAGPDHSGHGGGRDAPAAPGERSSHPSSDAPRCPMAAAAGMACGVSAAPVVSAAAPLAVEMHAPAVPAADEAPASPQLSSLFRPPRR